jgi:hypothetical protein
MDYLAIYICRRNIEADRAFNPVKVVVKSRTLCYKKWCRNTKE